MAKAGSTGHERGPAEPSGSSRARDGADRVLTVPNALSFLRIALIPVFVWLIVDPDTTFAGLVMFGLVLATDWIDGAIARATGQVSNLGKVLDPVSDRLAIAAGLIALVVRDAFPLWAALLILVRDGLILVAGVALLVARRVRIEVRYLGKVATFGLMVGIGCIAWGNLGYALSPTFLACGWVIYAVAIVEYYVATIQYVGDLRDVLASEPAPRSC
jgi:cardiolipin synthase